MRLPALFSGNHKKHSVSALFLYIKMTWRISYCPEHTMPDLLVLIHFSLNRSYKMVSSPVDNLIFFLNKSVHEA